MDWHHVVEQTPANVSRFGAEQIHNTSNVVRIDRVRHYEINAFYSSINQRLTGSKTLTVREWVGRMSFEQQQKFGDSVVKIFADVKQPR
jgi:hypothetical protein